MGLDPEDTAVIDDDMIAEAFQIDGLGEDELGNKITVESQEVQVLADEITVSTQLKLSFRNVWKIGNLEGFDNLRKLCLDNNIIAEVTGISHLVHLEWLDLSFNNIEKISGLEKLTKLTDLSLFANKISDIEGLEACSALQCLSLGNNEIKNLDSVVKLRPFKKLHLLNLEGNPVSREADYRVFTLAYLNNLKYLDYAMVVKSEVAAAREQYQDELMEVEEKESLEEEKLARERAAAANTAKLKAANLSFTESIFSDMFEDDEDDVKLKALPGIQDKKARFSSEVDELCQQFLELGLGKDKAKTAERDAFTSAIAQMRQYYLDESVKLTSNWVVKLKRTTRELQLQERIFKMDIVKPEKELDALHSALMDLELRQVEHFETVHSEFDTKYRELNANVLESHMSFFRKMEDCEKEYNKEVITLANELLDQAAKEELPEDLSEEAQNLLLDRDTCLSAITGSHDVHVNKIFKVGRLRSISGDALPFLLPFLSFFRRAHIACDSSFPPLLQLSVTVRRGCAAGGDGPPERRHQSLPRRGEHEEQAKGPGDRGLGGREPGGAPQTRHEGLYRRGWVRYG
jgi:hypothetical protein